VTTAGRVLDVARSQIGTIEKADGSNPYGAAYGMDRVAWCNEFTWWCFSEADATALTPKSAYTPATASWYQQDGRADRSPRVGSLVFYDWPNDGVDRISHVGFVEAVNADGTITTIEGNTTSGVLGDQRMGGGVWRRKRSTSSVVIYGHPEYTDTPAVPSPPVVEDMATLQQGMRADSRVMVLQRFLNAYNWRPELPLLPVTGNYLAQTTAVVKGAQAQCGITGPDANGTIVGPRTKQAFHARGARW
jgi:surface antigen